MSSSNPVEEQTTVVSPQDALSQLWTSLDLPTSALSSVNFSGPNPAFPSTFALTSLSLSTLSASALSASLILSTRNTEPLNTITLNSLDVAAEFRSEHYASNNGVGGKTWDTLAGVYRAGDGGLVRPHTNWKHHKYGILRMLVLRESEDVGKDEVEAAFLKVMDSEAFVEEAMKKGLVVTRLRTFDEWVNHPQGIALAREKHGPIKLQRLNTRPPKAFPTLKGSRRPLAGIRVLEMTRVIAGPTAGRTLAAYGADVILVSGPHLPSLPSLDFDTTRGKRTVSLDLRPSSPASPSKRTFHRLLSTCDVLLQSYSPGALSRLGYTQEEILKVNPDIIVASLSAWGTKEGPWKERKGFDSLVQHGTGFGESEGEAYARWSGEGGGGTRALPCQALDHASGYLLAYGIQAAIHKRSRPGNGGAYLVTSSLADTALYLRSLGREAPDAFGVEMETLEQLKERDRMDTLKGWNGSVEGVKHSAKFENAEVGCRRSPNGLDEEDEENVGWLDT